MGTLPTVEEIEDRISLGGARYTANIWQLLKARDIFLTPEEAELYHVVQKAHIRLTGHSLPPLKGARKTKAQVRNERGPDVSEEVLEEAVQTGLAARLAKMREGK